MTSRVYMDNHATTRTDPRVVDAMLPYLTEKYGNPSSPHVFGWESAEALDKARTHVGALVGAAAKEIIFTSGSTEGNNIALIGAYRQRRDEGRHVVTTNVEHPSVEETLEALESEGAQVTQVPVRASGRVEVDDVIHALRDDTTLCSVIWAHNELGSINPVPEIAAACRERGVWFHTDATQAIGKIPIAHLTEHVDMLSLSAHKFYGPRGIGALMVRRRPKFRLRPILFGGGHERRLRPGTIATPLVVGLGVACQLAQEELDTEPKRVGDLRNSLLARFQAELDGVLVNAGLEHRLPGNLNVSFLGVESQALLLELRDVAISAGSACHTELNEPSGSLMALGRTAEEAHSSVRFGLGRFTTAEEVNSVADRVIEVVRRLRADMPAHEATSGGTPEGESK